VPGQYTFYSKSMDGSLLYLNDSLLVDNHGATYPGVEKSGSVTLAAGFYSLVVDYTMLFGGSNQLVVSYQGPGTSKQKIPAAALFHSSTGMPPSTGLSSLGKANSLMSSTIHLKGRATVDLKGRMLCRRAGRLSRALCAQQRSGSIYLNVTNW
jgi:hypothetical protein